jgi:hypothetical protein
VADAEVDEAYGCGPYFSGFKFHRPPQRRAMKIMESHPVSEEDNSEYMKELIAVTLANYKEIVEEEYESTRK